MTTNNTLNDAKDPHAVNDTRNAPDSRPGSDTEPSPDDAVVEEAESAEDAFSDEERRERDRLTKKGRAKLKRGHLANIEFGQILRVLRDKRLYREGGMTLEEFANEEFDLTAESVRRHIAFTELHEAFEQAGAEPLLVKSQVTELLPLPTLDDQVRAAQRGRELAEAEGTRLAARHIKEARKEIEDELLGEAKASADPMAEVKDEVRARGGLHVVVPETALPEGVVEDEIAQCYLPGRVIARYDDVNADHNVGKGVADEPSVIWDASMKGQTRTGGLTRIDLDEVAEFAWLVVGPDAWDTATTWEGCGESLAATFHPDRLSDPSVATSVAKARGTDETREAKARSTTVLAAPGVDLLHPDLPDPVLGAVVAASGEDPERRYLFLTEHPERAAGVEWTANAVVCVTASDAASVTEMAESVAEVAEGAGVRFALVLRDAEGALPAVALESFAWVLIRGKKTSQASYDSVLRAVPYDRVQVGRQVHARPLGYIPVEEPTDEPPFEDIPSQEIPSQEAILEAEVVDEEIVEGEGVVDEERTSPARDRRPVSARGILNGDRTSPQKKPKTGAKEKRTKKRTTLRRDGDGRPFAHLTPVRGSTPVPR